MLFKCLTLDYQQNQNGNMQREADCNLQPILGVQEVPQVIADVS